MTNHPGLPGGIYAASDYLKLAQDALPEAVYAYLSGGAGQEITLQRNSRYWEELCLAPRLLTNVRQGSTDLTMAGEQWQHPFLLAPVAHQQLFHKHAETEMAMGAAASDTPVVLSTLSSQRVEYILANSPANRYWFQLYFQPAPGDTLELVNRARAAGCSALVVTLDSVIQMPSFRALRAGFPFSRLPLAANLIHHLDSQQALAEPRRGSVFSRYMQYAPVLEDLKWLLAETDMPVWVKGIMRADDARVLKQMGCAGVIISNHGGRGLDGCAASGSVIAAVRQAVGSDYPVLVDGGIQSGADAFKAIALGANAVLVGKLQACALAVGGAMGVGHLMKLLREELEMTMALCGCASIAKINSSYLKGPEN